jgi:hypothetical protein
MFRERRLNTILKVRTAPQAVINEAVSRKRN